MASKKSKKLILLFVFFLGLSVFLSAKSNAYFSDKISSTSSFSAGNWETNPKIVINEIYPNPAAGGLEQIELYNDSDNDIDLTDWTIEDGNYSPRSLTGKIILAKSFLVLTKGSGADFTFGLNNDGDILILKKGIEIIDQVSWGIWVDGNLVDNAVNPAQGKSIGRYPDGLDTNFDLLDFNEMNISLGLINIYP